MGRTLMGTFSALSNCLISNGIVFGDRRRMKKTLGCHRKKEEIMNKKNSLK